MQKNEQVLDLVNQGIVLMKAQKYSEARELFRQALEQEPEYLDTYLHLGNACVNLGELDEAVNAFTSALVVDKQSGEALFSLANVYYLKDDLRNAIKHYVKAENAGYRNPDMYLIMGEIFYSADDAVQALRYVTKAVNEEPLRGELWRKKVVLELELGDVDAAMESLDDFEELLPEALDIHELRTKILLELQRYDDAREHLEKALAMFPQDTRIHLLKIELESAGGCVDAAKAEIEAVKMQGLDEGFRKQIALLEAEIYLKEENPEKIVECVTWGLQEAPNDADLLFIMLNTHIATLDYENIITFADKLLTLESVAPSVTASAEFYRALALRETGKTEEAAEKFKKLAKTLRKLTIDNPESVDIFIYRILTHSALKEYDKALELADYVGQVSPNASDAHAFRSLVYRDMGDMEKAEAELALAKKINPDLGEL